LTSFAVNGRQLSAQQYTGPVNVALLCARHIVRDGGVVVLMEGYFFLARFQRNGFRHCTYVAILNMIYLFLKFEEKIVNLRFNRVRRYGFLYRQFPSQHMQIGEQPRETVLYKRPRRDETIN
jgi:hypothetical protein